MRSRLIAALLAVVCLMGLVGCSGTTEPVPDEGQTSEADVVIKVDEIQEGVRVSDVSVEVLVYGEPVQHELEWIIYETDDYAYLEQDDVFPADFFGRLDVYYDLPAGTISDNLTVEIEAPGGTYDGTGVLGDGDEGGEAVWSHIQYGTEPEGPAEPETPDASDEAKPSDHTHKWVLDERQSTDAGCTYGGYKFEQCSVCYATRSESTPAKGHNYISMVVKDPTCTDGGVERFSCLNCGTVYEEYIPPKGHSWSYESNGTSTHRGTCGNCRASVDEERHTPSSDGTCTACGEYVVN